MRIAIDPTDNDSWLNWGKLVYAWVNKAERRPGKVGDLKTLLTKWKVKADVEGDNQRGITIVDYDDDVTAPLVLTLPSKVMLDAKYGKIQAGKYPLPDFYKIAFGGANEVNLSLDQAHDFGYLRIGEYTINECC